ncbi:MAG: TIGR03618 family F420-dependent PPOX class oxidoreductase [Chloroflexi bacterium]|nr:TIGR03618 family F420-dependent PPOX class oxidoreductase [Chloroflexota bacterium]
MPDASGAMSDQELEAFLDGKHLAIITTNGADGAPHSTPVWYLAERDGALAVIVLRNAVKLRNIERDPLISITIAPETRPYAFARFRGAAEVLYDDVGDYPLAMAQRYMGDGPGRKWLEEQGQDPFAVIRLLDPAPNTWMDTSSGG